MVEAGLDAHLVHLGTMGVYGYGTAGVKIPEGYLPVRIGPEHVAKAVEILYPPNPGSIYHMTKTQDQLFFFYYNKNNGIRITDLHQGIVWGTQTDQTSLHEALINRFDYDGDYGTVLNRFLMQAAVGIPLTVHGTGGQTRAFIHIRDTVRCIEIALRNPPKRGERVKIFNQMTETHRLIDLAKRISAITGVPFQFVDNPRAEERYGPYVRLRPKRNRLLRLRRCPRISHTKSQASAASDPETLQSLNRRYARNRPSLNALRCSRTTNEKGAASPASRNSGISLLEVLPYQFSHRTLNEMPNCHAGYHAGYTE
jgi:nucleoside-diphosphate-sugar epimerase